MVPSVFVLLLGPQEVPRKFREPAWCWVCASLAFGRWQTGSRPTAGRPGPLQCLFLHPYFLLLFLLWGEAGAAPRGLEILCQAESAGQRLCPERAEAQICSLHSTRCVAPTHRPKGTSPAGRPRGRPGTHRAVVVGSGDTGGAGFVFGEGGPEGSEGATAHLPGLSSPLPFHPHTHSPPNSTCRKNWGGRKE